MKISNEETIRIENKFLIEDSLKLKQKVNVQIEAAHAGTINGNFLFYTPKSLIKGAASLKDFYKPLQKKHYSKTLGYIYDSSYTDTSNGSTHFKKINEATTPEDLVKAVKSYLKSNDFKQSKGFGVLTAKASLHDAKKIKDLKNHDVGTVSIAGDSSDAYCSICSGMIAECDHKLGARYNNETCIGIVADNLELDHISFETIPANWETGTLIIQDSQIYGKLEIITEGQPMKLTLVELREKLLGNLEEVLTSLELSEFIEQYKVDISVAKNSEFLSPADKVLPFNTPLTIYVAQKLIEQLEDSEDKEVIVSTLGAAYSTLFEGKSEEEILSLVREVEVKEVPAVVVDEPVVEEVVKSALEVTDADKLAFAIADSVASAIDEKFTGIVEKLTEIFTKEANGKANKILEDRIEAFKADLNSAEVFKDQLSDELKDSLVNQIILLKNIPKDHDYISVLKNRNIQDLKRTLEDHLFLDIKSSVIQETPVIVADTPVLAVADSQTEINSQVDVTIASSEMSEEDPTVLEITDEDKILSDIVSKLPEEKLTKTSFTKLYKEVFFNHGSHIAKKLQPVLKQQNKL